MGLVSLRSNLAINGTPDRYDTQGKLSDLPPGASQLDFDGALPPVRDYFTGPQPSQGQELVTALGFPGALPAPVDNFINTYANGFTIQNPVGVTQFIDDGQTSIFGPGPGTPDKYDTTGILGTLPPGSSQLNFDGALPAPVDFITNNNARGFTIGMNTTQFKRKGQTSRLGFAAPLPAPVDFFLNNNARGFTLNMNSSRFRNQGQTSQLGFPGPIPGAQDFFLNTHANGFTIRMNSTQFKNDGQTSQFGFTGALPAPVDYFTNDHAAGFTLRAPVGVTQFAFDGQTSQYGFTGKLPPPVDFFTNAHANGFTIQAPTLVSQFIDPGNSSQYGFPGALPAPVDFFTNDHAAGFTLRAPVGITQFAFDGQTSQYGFQGKLPPAADWLSNRFAKGFTIQNPVGVSQFVGIQANTYTNPSGKNLINTQPGPSSTDWFSNRFAKGFTIKNPIGVSQFVGIDTSGGRGGGRYVNPNPFNRIGKVTNWFPDETSGAKGFKDKVAPYETGYIGISADSTKYQYPNTVAGGRLLNVRLGQGAGTAKLENQLGNGSKMGNTGFYAENRYGEAVRNADNQSLLASWALRRRSPSPLEQQYSKFKLRDEAFNPTFIAHPLILRGLQNPDVLNPQRWGLDALGQQEGRTAANNIVAAIDGGFIRGGASTALERSVIDTARIAKFLASPKGLVWSITQVGLGKSNVRPYGYLSEGAVTALTGNPLPAINNTHTHLGLTSLLSVPGSAFGLHFTRHGVPFLNEAVDYSNFHRGLKRDEITNGTSLNKLVLLKSDLLDLKLPYFVAINSEIPRLTGPGGPRSVYGLGVTPIRRYTDTLEGWKRFLPISKLPPVEVQAVTPRSVEGLSLPGLYEKLDQEFSPKYSISKQYAPELNNNETLQGYIPESKTEGKRFGISNADWENATPSIGIGKKLANLKQTYRVWNPGNGTNPNLPSKNLNEVYSSQESSLSGNKYRSLPYSEIRNIARDRTSRTATINDFRTKANETANINTKTFSTNPVLANYAENNLTKRYGFGDHGSTNPTIDRSDPYSGKNNSGNSVPNIDNTLEILETQGKFALSNNPNFRGDKITAIDYIPESKAVDKTGIYPENTRDFIKFYFSGVNLYDNEKDDAIVFRATIKGLNDSFSPSWSPVSIMGRPDGPAIYSSFERNISFQFVAAATSREELVPMWRKLNYLASYTMPIYGAGRPGGALCRMTIGDMFNNTPGYFTGLTITVNDEASWDLADDLESDNFGNASKRNKYAKQLPNIVDVDVQFKIIHDWRPQKGGRVYSLYDSNFAPVSAEGNWLWDSNI